MAEEQTARHEAVVEVIKGWDTRYSYAVVGEEKDGDRTGVTVQFSKPTKEHPIPLDVAVVTFYISGPSKPITYRIGTELFERRVDRFADVWLDRVISSKMRLRGADVEFDTAAY